ncbi:MAG: DUF2384 domain-containing protein [Candidatus Obscuribacter phosphatis]|uniref:DUF2384 domain-containing protein n=1 Tax=Candidatus Obscuribacter phosphatis TaxID=1906157 RepID=A0A8J7TM73_9BACT|nr:DUF2384 domain-containing protein [Candidatus Obscuribacter phosphatis]
MGKAAIRQKTKESVALTAFFNIAEKWELTTAQQMTLLGVATESTFFNYKRDPLAARINKDMLERLSYVLGIFKDLQVLFTDESSANSWIKKSNSAAPFNGRSALDFLLERGSIVDLHRVRQYLAAQRGI